MVVRRGKKKAAVAVGRLILELAYQLLSTGELYQDERIRPLVQGDPVREQRRLVRKLEALGHHVTLTPAA